MKKAFLSFLIVFSVINFLAAQETSSQESETKIFFTSSIETGFISHSIDENIHFLSGTFDIGSNITISLDHLFSFKFGRGEFSAFDDGQLILSAGYNFLGSNNHLIVGPIYDVLNGNIGVTSAYKYIINDKYQVDSKLALFLPEFSFNDPRMILGASVLYLMSEDINLFIDLNYADEWLSKFLTKENLFIGSVGAEYKIYTAIWLKGSLGYNFWDTSPGFLPQVSLLHSF